MLRTTTPKVPERTGPAQRSSVSAAAGTRQQRYGPPPDSRRTYTKSDWIGWTATMAERAADFRTLVHPIWLYANEMPSRVPRRLTQNDRYPAGGLLGPLGGGGCFDKLLAKKLAGDQRPAAK